MNIETGNGTKILTNKITIEVVEYANIFTKSVFLILINLFRIMRITSCKKAYVMNTLNRISA
jgi:hypothetical protein